MVHGEWRPCNSTDVPIRARIVSSLDALIPSFFFRPGVKKHFEQEWGTFTVLPTKMRCLYYWWEPDTTFLSLKGKQITYSPHDAAAFASGDVTSTAKGVSIDTWTWWLLWVGSGRQELFT